MKLEKFLGLIRYGKHFGYLTSCVDSEITFVGIKWQDEHHPSAEEFPIEFVSASDGGKGVIKLKFITKPKHE